jgi:hypothetical protein
MATNEPSWRELCLAASHEQDPGKLLQLLRAINQALAEQRLRTSERLA